MELRHLAHFVAVAEERNFTRAAQRLHIAQSGLSVSIRTLERSLGTALFDRTGPAVTLTEAGAVLLDHAHDLLAGAQRARDAVAEVVGGVRGTVRLGILQAMVLPGLADVLGEFRAASPLVRVEPSTAPGGSTRLADEVAEGRLDLALTALEPATYPASVTATVLGSEPMLLVLPAGHRLAAHRPVPMGELAGEEFVEFPAGWGTRRLVDAHFAAHDVPRSISIEVSDVTTAVELVRAGFGLAFLPRSVVRSREGVVVRPVDPRPRLRLSLIGAERRSRPAAVRALADRLVEFYARGSVPGLDAPGHP